MKENRATVPELGLVCITASDMVRYRSLTRKRLRQLAIGEQEHILRELYTDNLGRLGRAIDFCLEQRIRLYRITSSLLPFSDTPAGSALLAEFASVLKRIGERATESGMRLVIHPDQFVVLSSDSPAVLANSITILETQAQILDLLAQPRSTWAAMILHGGKADRGEQFVRVIKRLPDAIRLRLALENDEYSYSAEEILSVCRAAGVPMVFDAHHHVCHEQLSSYDDPSVSGMLTAARDTWPVPEWQLVHISNGREHFNDRHHSDMITFIPSAFREAPWIEVEAKQKEVAIERLKREWLGSVGDQGVLG